MSRLAHMTEERPNVTLDRRYNKKSCARLLVVSTSTITRWTNAGHINAHFNKMTSEWVYLGKDILRFWEKALI